MAWLGNFTHGTTVPKAAMHKHYRSLGSEAKVWLARQVLTV